MAEHGKAEPPPGPYISPVMGLVTDASKVAHAPGGAPGVKVEAQEGARATAVLDAPPGPAFADGPCGLGLDNGLDDLTSPLALERLSKEERRRLRMQLQAVLANVETYAVKIDEKKEKLQTKFKFSNVAPAAPRAAPGFGAATTTKRQPKPLARGGYMADEHDDYGPPPPARPVRDRRAAGFGGDDSYEPPSAAAALPPAPRPITRPPLPPPPVLPPPRGPREAKQRHVDAARTRRNAELLKICANILSACRKSSTGWLFASPVDPVALNHPDYSSIVKHPMDYGTVKAKMDNKEYDSPLAFKADMELIYANCALYNKPETEVGQHGVAASELFATEWEASGVEFKLQDEALIRHGEDAEVAALPEEGDIPPELLRAPGAPPPKKERDREVEKARRQERMAAQRAAEAEREQAVLGRHTNKRVRVQSDTEDDTDESEEEEKELRPARKRPAPVPQRRPTEVPPSQRALMKFEQKQQLSVALANLPRARQARVVQILPGSPKQGEYIELDLDQVDNTTLWRMFDYVFPKSQQIAMGIRHDDLVAPAAAPCAALGAAAAPAKVMVNLHTPAGCPAPQPPPPGAKPAPQHAGPSLSPQNMQQLAEALAALPAKSERARAVQIFSGLKLGAGSVDLSGLENSMLRKLFVYVIPTETTVPEAAVPLGDAALADGQRGAV